MGRNLEQEEILHEIHEDSTLNAVILLSLLIKIERCSIDQLSTAFYLYRFVNITSKLLSDNDRYSFRLGLPGWELVNLDVFLTPYLLEKYNSRFLRGLSELIARGLARFDDEDTIIQAPITKELQDFLHNEGVFMHKSEYVISIIKDYEMNELTDRINKIVGEEKWVRAFI